MKKSMLSFVLAICIAGISFASPNDSVTINPSPSICLSDGPITITATLHVANPAGARYQWQFWNDSTWTNIVDSTRDQLVVTSFAAYSEAYRVRVQLPTHTYVSRDTTLCHCGTVPIVLRLFTANVISSGAARFTFQFEQVGSVVPVVLQQSHDQFVWTDLVEVTEKTIYSTVDPISGKMYYRLKWVLPDGKIQYSATRFLENKTALKTIDWSKPFNVQILNSAGAQIEYIKEITNSFSLLPNQFYQQLLSKFGHGIYMLSFEQNGIRKTEKVPH